MTRIRIRILVVEDQRIWLDGLRATYEEVFREYNPIVHTIDNGSDALRQLQPNAYDLISADINLGSTHTRRKDGTLDMQVPGADGRAIIRRASEVNACRGLIVFTNLAKDQEIRVVIPDELDLKVTRMALDGYLEQLFGERRWYFSKDCSTENESDVNDALTLLRSQLNPERIVEKCGIVNRIVRNGQYWDVRFAGRTVKLKESKGRGLQLLARILERDDRPIAVEDLYDSVYGTKEIDTEGTMQDLVVGEDESPQEHGRGIILAQADVQAISEYRKRLTQIRADKKEAQESRTWDRLEELENEEEQIQKAVRDANWYRPVNSESEQKRQRVQRNLGLLLKEFEKEIPDLYRHLHSDHEGALQGGTMYRYCPKFPQSWDVAL